MKVDDNVFVPGFENIVSGTGNLYIKAHLSDDDPIVKDIFKALLAIGDMLVNLEGKINNLSDSVDRIKREVI